MRSFKLIIIEIKVFQHTSSHGDHHDGSSSVGDPHTDKSRSDHKTQQNQSGIHLVAAEEQQNSQRHALVKLVFLDSQRENKSSQHQRHRIVPVLSCHCVRIHDLTKGKQRQRQQCRDAKRHRLKHPPHRHPYNNTQHPCCRSNNNNLLACGSFFFFSFSFSSYSSLFCFFYCNCDTSQNHQHCQRTGNHRPESPLLLANNLKLAAAKSWHVQNRILFSWQPEAWCSSWSSSSCQAWRRCKKSLQAVGVWSHMYIVLSDCFWVQKSSSDPSSVWVQLRELRFFFLWASSSRLRLEFYQQTSATHPSLNKSHFPYPCQRWDSDRKELGACMQIFK